MWWLCGKCIVPLHPEINDTNITPYGNIRTFNACLLKFSFMDLHSFKNKTIHYNIMLQNKECFLKMAGLSVQHPVRLLGANMVMRMLVLFSKTW
jgi:hypothetical protein